ncbi:MAG: sensor domain-containing diguanylate cyclase [Wenzhouxiangella sp.]|nr:MAG: sensor domain-containing diguanylate cyclase [Wenzhouxiangella sp.]
MSRFATVLAEQDDDPIANREALQALAFQQCAIGMALLDKEGRWLDVNDEFCRMLGMPRGALLKRSYDELTVAEDIPASNREKQRLLSGQSDTVDLEKRYLRVDGTIIWVRIRASIVRDHPDLGTVLVTQARDVTEERSTREALEQHRSSLDLALAGADLGLWHWLVRAREVRFDRRASRILGYRPDEVDNRDQGIFSLCHPDDQPRLQEQLQVQLSGASQGLDLVIRLRRRSGGYMWLLLRGRVTERDMHDRPIQVSGTLMDVTKWKELEARLTRLAGTDELTGLLNRRAGVAALDEAISASQRQGRMLSMLLLDIDRFKAINDSLGHDVGDQVLAAVGSYLCENKRTRDQAIRWGGEEFAIILRDTDADGAMAQAARLFDGIAGLADQVIELERLTASLGVVTLRPGEGSRDLMKRADALMYRAKNAGRARIEADH